MIEKYTIKFGAAVSQKELEEALHEPMFIPDDPSIELKPGDKVVISGVRATLNQFKARIELVGDFEDIKKLSHILKDLSKK